ncbi:unnamed protein product, partial [Heterotrigona itama]
TSSRLIDRPTNFNLGKFPARGAWKPARHMQIALIYTVYLETVVWPARLERERERERFGGPGGRARASIATLCEHVPCSPMICDCACLATTLATTCVLHRRTCVPARANQPCLQPFRYERRL